MEGANVKPIKTLSVMLAHTAKGTEVSVVFNRDYEPNPNGWYCETFLYDNDGGIIDERWDDFTICPEDCMESGCIDSYGGPTGEAEEYARESVASIRDY